MKTGGYRRIPADNRIEFILDCIKEKGSVTSAQVSMQLELGPSSTKELLGEMVTSGLIEKRGAARSTHYILKSQ